MAQLSGAKIFRSSVFSKMNTFLPLGLAVAVAALMLIAPRGVPGATFAYASGAFVIAILVLAAALFHHVVVTFDGREIVLAYAIIKKRIPLEQIAAVRPHDIKWWHFGGTGIRLRGGGRAGWIAGSGPGVEIATGRAVYYANCERAQRLVAFVEDFKRAAGGTTQP